MTNPTNLRVIWIREVQSLETKREKIVGGVTQPNLIRREMLIFLISWQDYTSFDPNQGSGFGHCLGSQICGHCANVLTEEFHCWFSQVRLCLFPSKSLCWSKMRCSSPNKQRISLRCNIKWITYSGQKCTDTQRLFGAWGKCTKFVCYNSM